MLRDPRMSEWGNPAVAIPSLLLVYTLSIAIQEMQHLTIKPRVLRAMHNSMTVL